MGGLRQRLLLARELGIEFVLKDFLSSSTNMYLRDVTGRGASQGRKSGGWRPGLSGDSCPSFCRQRNEWKPDSQFAQEAGRQAEVPRGEVRRVHRSHDPGV